jgi:transposase-like protein
MPKPSITEKRRKAIALVLEDKLSPTQVGRALNFTRPAVERWVREYLARHPDGPPPESSYGRACLVSLSPPREQCPPSPAPATAFVAIRLDDEVIPAPPSPISVEILTVSGFVMRLQLPTVYDVAMLLRSLEAESC